MAHDEKTDDRAKLYRMIDEVKIAMLTTVEADGSLHTRPMANQETDASGDLWFFTDKTESVAKNVLLNPNLSLGFSDPHGDNYAVVSGKGTLVDDRATIDAKWNDALKAWFPNGKSDPKIVLLKVEPSRGEYWDTASSTLATVVGFVKARLGAGSGNDMVDQAKVDL